MFAVLCALLCPTGAAARIYYAATNNPNAADVCAAAENIATPMRTLNNAARCLAAGDTLLVRGGTYAEALLYNIPSGTSWNSKVRIAAYPGETVWMRPASGTDRVLEFAYFQQYIEIDGINLDGANVSYDVVKINGSDAAAENAHHIRIQNAEILGNDTGAGFSTGHHFLLTALSDNIIGFNEFINLTVHRSGSAGNYHHGFYVQSGDNLIEGCRIYDYSGHGVQLYSFYNETVSSRNTVRNNIFSGQATYAEGIRAIVMRGTDNRFYNNLVYGIDAGTLSFAAVYVWGGSNHKIYNNTIYGTLNGVGLRVESGVSGVVVRNNIGFGNAQGDYLDLGSNTTASNNLNGADPRFVNAAAGNFQLQPGSPARDAGATIPLVVTDILGVTRPQGAAYDMGAYESGSTSTPACDVNRDGSTNVNDVQLSANQAIGVSACLPAGQAGSADINRDGACNVIDVQRVVNAALGGQCVSP